MSPEQEDQEKVSEMVVPTEVKQEIKDPQTASEEINVLPEQEAVHETDGLQEIQPEQTLSKGFSGEQALIESAEAEGLDVNSAEPEKSLPVAEETNANQPEETNENLLEESIENLPEESNANQPDASNAELNKEKDTERETQNNEDNTTCDEPGLHTAVHDVVQNVFDLSVKEVNTPRQIDGQETIAEQNPSDAILDDKVIPDKQCITDLPSEAAITLSEEVNVKNAVQSEVEETACLESKKITEDVLETDTVLSESKDEQELVISAEMASSESIVQLQAGETTETKLEIAILNDGEQSGNSEIKPHQMIAEIIDKIIDEYICITRFS